jgi:hypothetical protein
VKAPINQEKHKRIGAKTLYFVDSCTERQLDGGHRRHGSADSVGSARGIGAESDKERTRPDEIEPEEGKTLLELPPGDLARELSLTSIREEVSHSHEPQGDLILAPTPSRIFSDFSELPISPRDDYSLNDESLGGDTSQVLPEDSQQAEFGLEIRSEPNLSPLLIRDSDTNSDGGSVRSSFEGQLGKDSLRLAKSRRAVSYRSKLASSLPQQITTKQRTLIHGRGLDLGPNIGHHRSTSDPSLFFQHTSLMQSPREDTNPPHPKALETPAPPYPRRPHNGCISPADSLDPHGYALDNNSQSSRVLQADTVDTVDDLMLSPDLRSIQSGEDLPPFMKKSLSLDYGLNKLKVFDVGDKDSARDTAKALSVSLTPALHASERDSPSKRRVDALSRKTSAGPNSKSLSETTWTILRQQVRLILASSCLTDDRSSLG